MSVNRWGFDSHAFYNLVVEMKTELSLADFALTLREIELRWGRDSQAKKFQDRTLDLDIILFGDTVSRPWHPFCLARISTNTLL